MRQRRDTVLRAAGQAGPCSPDFAARGTSSYVEASAQRGFSLIESVVAAAVAAAAVGALACAMGEFGRFSSHQAGPVRESATALAEQTLRVASDAWKYGSPGGSPSGTAQTALSLVTPQGIKEVPVSVTTSLTAAAAWADVTVTVRYPPDADHVRDSGAVTVRGSARVKAPPPNSIVAPPGLVPQPDGAP